MKTILVAVGMVALSGCAMTFDLVGGPRNERSSISSNAVLDEMAPKVQASPTAASAVSSLRTRERVGKVLTYSGLGTLLPCMLTPVVGGKFTLVSAGVVIASCSTTIVLELIAVLVLPKLGDYGNVLRAFNADFPATPYTSVSLGVDAPRRDPSSERSASLVP